MGLSVWKRRGSSACTRFSPSFKELLQAASLRNQVSESNDEVVVFVLFDSTIWDLYVGFYYNHVSFWDFSGESYCSGIIEHENQLFLCFLLS